MDPKDAGKQGNDGTEPDPKDAGGDKGTPKPQDDSGVFVHPETGEKYVPIGISRKWETRAKENYDAKKRLDEIEDASKTELQRANEGKATAEKDADGHKREAMRLRVALRRGLTETQAKRLVGDTEEELEQDADDLLASFRPTNDADSDKGDGRPTRPKERLRSGAAPDEEPEETDPHKLAASVPRL